MHSRASQDSSTSVTAPSWLLLSASSALRMPCLMQSQRPNAGMPQHSASQAKMPRAAARFLQTAMAAFASTNGAPANAASAIAMHSSFPDASSCHLALKKPQALSTYGMMLLFMLSMMESLSILLLFFAFLSRSLCASSCHCFHPGELLTKSAMLDLPLASSAAAMLASVVGSTP